MCGWLSCFSDRWLGREIEPPRGYYYYAENIRVLCRWFGVSCRLDIGPLTGGFQSLEYKNLRSQYYISSLKDICHSFKPFCICVFIQIAFEGSVVFKI